MEFHKDLSKLGWNEVKTRQLHRLPLVKEWLNLVSLTKAKRLLDIGPGAGVFLNEYASQMSSNGKIVAIEKSAEAISFINEVYKYSNVSVICWDLELPLEEDIGTFDIVMLTDVLHHTENPEALLKNLQKYMTKETYILIAEFDPQAEGLIGPPLVNRISLSDMKVYVENSGFQIIKEGKQNFEHYYVVIRYNN
jgi:2-polyprenyl-3-methyl-5-hydroxy-6-metoxy-1,4-benzoquinol methylase